MIFNGDANGQDLCTLADKFLKTSDTDFLLSEKALYANLSDREILSWILSVYGGWTFDDSNNSTLPTATTDLVSGQTTYTLPDMLELKAVAYKLQNQDSWSPLIPITLEEIQRMGYAEAEFERTPGNPTYYRPVSNTIKIYPAANFSQDDSLKIELTRDMNTFTASSTNTAPGYASAYHEATAVGMALRHALINGLSSLTRLQEMWDGNEEKTGREGGFKKRIKDYYRTRFVQKSPQTIKRPAAGFVEQFM